MFDEKRAPVLLSLGSINADFQMRVDNPLGSDETLLARDFARLGGGKAANRAFLARRLGVPAWLVGRVGGDEFAEQALSPLHVAGVDLAGVTVAADCATSVSIITVPPDGKKSILLASNANDVWDDTAIGAGLDRVAAAPPGSVLTADCEIPEIVVRRVTQAATGRDIRLIVDPSWPARVGQEILATATAIAPNAAEAAALTGIVVSDPDRAAKAAQCLGGRGPSLTLVKLQDGGCVLWDGRLATHVPPVDVAMVDSTGAGDAFTGALSVALLEEQTPLSAAVFATAASHVAVSGWGSQPAYPTRVQIEQLVPRLARGARLLSC